MKKTIKRSTALLLCMILLASSLATGSGAYSSKDSWNAYWQDESESINAGVIVAPGQHESERRFSWYSDEYEGDCFVKISLSPSMADAKVFTGTFETTPQGDRANNVTATGLEDGKTYYYTCCSGDFTSPVATITTLGSNDFSAMYVTDVHISADDADEYAIRDDAYVFSSVISDAQTRSDISLILSAGDQASAGLREEYIGYAASPLLKNLTTAIAIGNHDKKNIDYKYFNNNPETNDNGVRAYIGGDYWFVKGNVLFLIMDSNNGDAVYHRTFVKNAVKANPDAKWRVAMSHHDLFGGRIEHRESENELLRTIWGPIYDEFSIDLALLGHSHYYTVSNVIYDNKTVMSTKDVSQINNAQGTVFMVSGSITRPRELEDGEVPPLGENIGQSHLTDEPIYNVLDFSDGAITVKSYTLGVQKEFNSFTLTKDSQQGGHPDKRIALYNAVVRFIGKIVAIVGNISDAYDLYEKYGIRLPVFKAIFG